MSDEAPKTRPRPIKALAELPISIRWLAEAPPGHRRSYLVGDDGGLLLRAATARRALAAAQGEIRRLRRLLSRHGVTIPERTTKS